MNWGKSIIVAFVLFAALIITLVYMSMQHDVNLVAKNYYEEELAYQDQIDRIKNFNELKNKPVIKRSGDLIIVSFPEELVQDITSGEILFFRPSDHSVDKRIALKLDKEHIQTFKASAFGKGLWRAKLKWTSDDKEYFAEQRIVL